MGEIVDKVRTKHFRAFQFLCHFIKALSNCYKIRIPAHDLTHTHAGLKITGSQTIHTIDQITNRLQRKFTCSQRYQ